MANFENVIRRTVNGLESPTREIRAEVYEKAYGAVTRQLEMMTPRPSESMILRQQSLVRAAIGLVERDFPPGRLNPDVLPFMRQAPVTSPNGRKLSASLVERLVSPEIAQDFLANLNEKYSGQWAPRDGTRVANQRWRRECIGFLVAFKLAPLQSLRDRLRCLFC